MYREQSHFIPAGKIIFLSENTQMNWENKKNEIRKN